MPVFKKCPPRGSVSVRTPPRGSVRVRTLARGSVRVRTPPRGQQGQCSAGHRLTLSAGRQGQCSDYPRPLFVSALIANE